MEDVRSKLRLVERSGFRPFVVDSPVHDATRRWAIGGHVTWLEAEDLIAELCEDQLILSTRVTGLGRTSRANAQALGAGFRARVSELARVRDALAALLLTTDSVRVHRAFLPEAPLAEYLRGAFAWTLTVVRALERFAVSLLASQPDRSTLYARLEAARNFHFDELEPDIRDDLGSLRADAAKPLTAAFDVLLDAARRLEALEPA